MPNTNRFNTKEEYNAWFREYRARNREKFRKYNREYNREWRKKNGYHNELKWKEEHPERVKAQQLAQQAVRDGVIFKEPCSMCGDINAVMHHDDYNKPLTVTWLCKIDHRKVHYGS